MITSDVNIEDNIVNVLVGEFFHINIETGPIKTVYGKFKCESIGRDVIQSDRIGRGNGWLSICKQETSFNSRNNKPEIRTKQ